MGKFGWNPAEVQSQLKFMQSLVVSTEIGLRLNPCRVRSFASPADMHVDPSQALRGPKKNQTERR